jgi:hypothetical protein
LVDESLAAGVFSLRAGTAGGGKAEFTLMVVDFGGGTTDITVFRVKRDPKTKALLQVEIIGAWGVANLGGEDITQEVAQMLLAEFAGKPEPHSADSRKAASGESRKMVSDAELLKVTISELEELRRQTPSADAATLIAKLDRDALRRIGYLCLFDAGAKPEDLQKPVHEYLSKGTLAIHSAMFASGKRVIEFPCAKVIEAYETRLTDLKRGLLKMLEMIALPKVDQILLAGQSSRFPVVREKLRDIAGDINFVTDAKGNMLLKECVSQGALMLVGQQVKIEGENRLWTRLGYVLGAEFKDLVPWGSRYPFSSQDVTFTRDDIFQGWLEIEINENTSLDANVPYESFCRFRIRVDDGVAGPFVFRLQLDETASVLGFCRFPGEADERKMEFVPSGGPA